MLNDPYSYGMGTFAATGELGTPGTGAVGGPTNVEGDAFAAGGGSADAEVYRFATIKTDKDDASGEFAVITGSGWRPGEGVKLVFQENPAVHPDYVIDSNGDPLIVTDVKGDIQMGQTGLPGGSPTCTVGNFQLITSPAIPTGVTAAFSDSTVTGDGGVGQDPVLTMVIHTTALTPPGRRGDPHGDHARREVDVILRRLASARSFHRSLAIVALGVVLSVINVGPAHAQTTPASALLELAGWDALKAGQIQQAADAFRRAVAEDPHSATSWLGAGLAADLLGQAAEARRALEHALQIDSHLKDAARLLGEIDYREGDLPAAIHTYEDALSREPGNAELREKLARWRREAALHDDFDRRVSNHFTVLFEGEVEQQIAERALQILEAAYWHIGANLSSYPSASITVVLYTQEQFRDITRSPQWAGGLFDGKIRVPVRGALERPDEFQRVLTHELTHALIRTLAPSGLPTWLNEGLAVLFEGKDLDWATRRLSSSRQHFALSDLHGSFSNLNAEQAAVAYAESALAVEALLYQVGGAGVTTLLTDLSDGVEFAAAFERRALMSYSEFQVRWRELEASPPAPTR